MRRSYCSGQGAESGKEATGWGGKGPLPQHAHDATPQRSAKQCALERDKKRGGRGQGWPSASPLSTAIKPADPAEQIATESSVSG